MRVDKRFGSRINLNVVARGVESTPSMQEAPGRVLGVGLMVAVDAFHMLKPALVLWPAM